MNPLKPKFPVLHNHKNCSIKCLIDASLGNLPTGKSTEGLIIFICDEFGNCSPLNWKLRSIKRVVRRILYREIKENSLNHKIDAYTNNKSIYRNVHSTTIPEENRMRIDIAQIRQMLNNHELNKFLWLPISEQSAAWLQKKGSDSLLLTSVLETGMNFVHKKLIW